MENAGKNEQIAYIFYVYQMLLGNMRLLLTHLVCICTGDNSGSVRSLVCWNDHLHLHLQVKEQGQTEHRSEVIDK